MDIVLAAPNAMASDSTKAYQEASKLSRTAVSQDAVETDSETAKDTDTVEISEAARNKQRQSAEATSDGALANQAQATDEGAKEENSTSTREMLLKQIQKVKEQLDEAKSRLAAATAKHQSSNGGEGNEPSQEARADNDGKDVSGTEVSEGSQDPEVKTIMSEVNQLTATLVTLNAQLLKEEQKGGAAGTTGSAGINEGSGLSGGLGERLPLKA